jgi:hypothetical protein
MTIAQDIWTDLTSRDFEMFSMSQPVAKYCTPIFVNHDKLHLKYSLSSVLAFLENAYGGKYNFELIDAYIVVSVKEPK